MQLTPNFDSSEFSSRGVPVPLSLRPNLQRLATNLQVLRDDLGVPISIHSGYRTLTHNESVGGRPQSEHLAASAADFTAQGFSPARVYCAVERLIRTGAMLQGGLGIYPAHTHYDVRGYRARWAEGVATPDCGTEDDMGEIERLTELLRQTQARQAVAELFSRLVAKALAGQSATAEERAKLRYLGAP